MSKKLNVVDGIRARCASAISTEMVAPRAAIEVMADIRFLCRVEGKTIQRVVLELGLMAAIS